MLDASKIGRLTKTIEKIAPGDSVLRLQNGVSQYFAPASGAHYYATLVDGHRREIVQVTGGSGTELYISRGQDDTDPLHFPAGTCVIVEWNPAQLCEFMKQCVDGSGPVISPGTFCLDCTTCITVDAGGRITDIDGAEGC